MSKSRSFPLPINHRTLSVSDHRHRQNTPSSSPELVCTTLSEMAQVSERIRPRSSALPMEIASADADAAATSPKRRKITTTTTNNNNASDDDLGFSPSSSVQFESTTSGGGGAPPAVEQRFSGATSDESSCCSSNESFCLIEKSINKFSDPEVESTRLETTTFGDGYDEEEAICRRREKMMSPATNSQEVEEKKKKQQKMPTESELEEFFSAAEKDIQERFSHKYNYDIVKDVPLEGRYEWVELKP